MWIVQWGGRVALGSEKKFAYITRFNTTCFERQLETVRTDRTHPLHQSLIFAPFFIESSLKRCLCKCVQKCNSIKIRRNLTEHQNCLTVLISRDYIWYIFHYTRCLYLYIQCYFHDKDAKLIVFGSNTIIFGSNIIIFGAFSTFPLYTILHFIFILQEDCFVNFKWQIKW